MGHNSLCKFKPLPAVKDGWGGTDKGQSLYFYYGIELGISQGPVTKKQGIPVGIRLVDDNILRALGLAEPDCPKHGS